MNEAILMMVMVSLNLADVTTAIRPKKSRPFHDDSDNPPSPGRVKAEVDTESDASEPESGNFQIVLRGD